MLWLQPFIKKKVHIYHSVAKERAATAHLSADHKLNAIVYFFSIKEQNYGAKYIVPFELRNYLQLF